MPDQVSDFWTEFAKLVGLFLSGGAGLQLINLLYKRAEARALEKKKEIEDKKLIELEANALRERAKEVQNKLDDYHQDQREIFEKYLRDQVLADNQDLRKRLREVEETLRLTEMENVKNLAEIYRLREEVSYLKNLVENYREQKG